MDLDHHPFFNFFHFDAAKELISVTEVLPVDAGETVFRESDPPDYLYLILSGKVLLTKVDGSDASREIATLTPGDYFGELALLDGLPRSTGARMTTAGRLGRLDAAAFNQALSQASVDTFRSLVRRISVSLRTTNESLLEERLRKEKMTLLGEMAGTIIHDLRSPFTIIGLSCETIKMRSENPEITRFSEIIARQVDRMTTMVGEILEFSKGSPALHPRPVEITRLFEVFVDDNRLELDKKALTLEVLPSLGGVICDEEKILRVLQNLFNNAADAMGDKPGKIVVEAKPNGELIEIWMIDNGPGIPAEIQTTLFDPFVTRNKKQGTGLGLAIVKSIVTSHGGEIFFETQPGAGTKFRISLPRYYRNSFEPG